VVVVESKGAIRVVNLGGRVLYISTGPLAQLTPLEMGVYPRVGVETAPGRILRMVEWICRLPDKIQKTSRGLREDEEMPGEDRGRFERNEASYQESWSRLIIPTR